jgi:hypothetical protein
MKPFKKSRFFVLSVATIFLSLTACSNEDPDPAENKNMSMFTSFSRSLNATVAAAKKAADDAAAASKKAAADAAAAAKQSVIDVKSGTIAASSSSAIVTIGSLPDASKAILLAYQCVTVPGSMSTQASFTADQSLNAFDSCGTDTPLCYAAGKNDYATLADLMKAGADPKKTCTLTQTPLHIVLAGAGYTDTDGKVASIVSSLVNAGASVVVHNSNNQWTPLHFAASNLVPLSVWKALLPTAVLPHIDIDIPVSERNKGTPRSWAKGKLTAHPNYKDVVKYLNEYDTDDPNP